MAETTLPYGLETAGQRCIAKFGISLDVFDDFLGKKKKIIFVFLVQLQCIVKVLQRGGSVAVAVLVMTCDMGHVTGDT